MSRERVSLSRLTLDTGTGAVTVTAQEAVLLPSSVVAVTMVSPSATPVTKPVLETDAISALAELHTTFLFVALLGSTSAVSWSVSPLEIEAVVLFKATEVTATMSVTVTAQEAVLLPSSVVTVTMVAPSPTAVTKPVLETDAISVLAELHETVLFTASAGEISTESWSVL